MTIGEIVLMKPHESPQINKKSIRGDSRDSWPVWNRGITRFSFHINRNKICVARVKSGIFGVTAKFGKPPCLFHSSIIGIKNKLTKQTVKIHQRRFIRSRLIWISTV